MSPDPMLIRSVPHLRAAAWRASQWIESVACPSAMDIALAVQVFEMTGNPRPRAAAMVRAKSMATTAEGGQRHLLLVAANADRPAELLALSDWPGHNGFYAKIRAAYAAFRNDDPSTLERVPGLMSNAEGVNGKLMNVAWERSLVMGMLRLKLGENNSSVVEWLWDEAAKLSPHMSQGAHLDVLQLFFGRTFGQS